jgi:SagB-type dehydrogenase family enzyme
MGYKKWIIITIIVIGILLIILSLLIMKNESASKNITDIIKLPEPKHDGNISVEQTLQLRRSIRNYQNEPLTLTEVSQLVWAAQGITNAGGKRTTPSASALYPLELYVVAGNVNDLNQGIYKYQPTGHELVIILAGDKRNELAAAALSQSFIKDGAIVLIFAAEYSRTTNKYGERGIRYVHMEAGHAAQNVYLQATALNLGTVVVGAFIDDEIKKIMQLPREEEPLYIMPVGKIK